MIDHFEEIRKIISLQFGLDPETIEEESFLTTDLNISELDVEDLVSTLEDKYQIEIPQASYLKFHQVSDIINYLYENVDQP